MCAGRPGVSFRGCGTADLAAASAVFQKRGRSGVFMGDRGLWGIEVCGECAEGGYAKSPVLMCCTAASRFPSQLQTLTQEGGSS